MANFFDTQANFTNPSYATPEQLANARAYADALTKRSGEDAKRPTGAIANGLDALTAALMRNNANTMQQQAAEGNARDYSTLISQLQSGQKPSPEVLGRFVARPLASPEARAWATKLISPEFTKSQFGEPAYQSPATGVQAAPIHGPYTPGYDIDQGAGDVHQRMPVPAPTYQPQPPAINQSRAPVASSPKVWGDHEAQAAGLYPPSSPQPGAGGGAPGPAAVLPPAAAPAIPNTPLTLDQLAAKGREFQVAKAGATAQGEGNQDDVRAATAAPQVIKGLGLIKSTIENSPGITFGPTAGWSAEAKRVIANYAPGLTDEKSLAGADAIEKLNFGLASQLAKSVGGTQGELYKAIGSTPGTEKSKQGTLALIDMMQQDQMKAQQLGALYRQYDAAGRLNDYPAAREQFLKTHPVTNPLTGRPIEADIAAARAAHGGGYEKTATNPQTGEKLGLRNGKWEPIK